MALDGIGRAGGQARSYQSGDPRGEAVEQVMFLAQYRRDLIEIRRDVLSTKYPDDATAIDTDIRQVEAALHAAALTLADVRPEVSSDDLAPLGPDVQGFYGAVAVLLGGYARLASIDKAYPGIDRAIRELAWPLALAGIDQALADEEINESEYALIQAAWDTYRLVRPAE